MNQEINDSEKIAQNKKASAQTPKRTARRSIALESASGGEPGERAPSALRPRRSASGRERQMKVNPGSKSRDNAGQLR